jgi:hypothetical protein
MNGPNGNVVTVADVASVVFHKVLASREVKYSRHHERDASSRTFPGLLRAFTGFAVVSRILTCLLVVEASTGRHSFGI